ncbi:MAG: hypothetical protein Q8M34_08645, partial [Thermodesulfovibrionales bacterium]|nr:hypothetical protein [Thermodesulfovibrionales bacterium]
MGIKIDKISVKKLGPIQEFNKELSLLNLIYSPNSRGKTFLTEFIIRSLFKNIGRWKYLREDGNGKILISGLDESTVEFSPSTKKKLEDYWEKDGSGLPPSMVKLLVSKGAESSIEDTNGGISKNFMKEILSGISLLDKIDSDGNIPKTVKSAKLEDGNINIEKRGEGKSYLSQRDELAKIDELSAEIETKYTKGIIETDKIQEKLLQKQLEKFTKAKRYEAYLISEEIKSGKSELSQIPEDELNQISSDVYIYKSKKESYDRLNREKKESQEESKHFNWLQNALSEYEKLTTNIIKKPSSVFLFIAGILAAIPVIFILLNKQDKQVASIISFLAALILVGIYIKKLYDSSKYVGQNEELKNIKEEFKNRIGQELTDIALLETVLKEQEEVISKSKLIKEQLDDKDRELRDLYSSIKYKVFNLTEKEIKESEWDITVKDLKLEHSNLRNQIDIEKEKLHKLGVDETDYLHEDAGFKYSQEGFNIIESEFDKIKNEIRIKENELQNLKAKVCSKTGDDLSIGWEQLLENLRNKRFDKQSQLNELEAQIIGGIIIHKVISQLRKEEDAKIREELESEIVLKPLRDLTQLYNRLTLEGDTLIVSNDYNNFPLNDLSTGEKERVMLALRIGFSSKLLKQDSLFLI